MWPNLKTHRALAHTNPKIIQYFLHAKKSENSKKVLTNFLEVPQKKKKLKKLTNLKKRESIKTTQKVYGLHTL